MKSQPQFEIKQTTAYEVFGKQFANEYSAKRYAATELLRLALHQTGLPNVAQRIKPPQAQINGRRREDYLEIIDEVSQDLRTWLLEHVHTLLPVLNTLAEHHPKTEMQEGLPVDED